MREKEEGFAAFSSGGCGSGACAGPHHVCVPSEAAPLGFKCVCAVGFGPSDAGSADDCVVWETIGSDAPVWSVSAWNMQDLFFTSDVRGQAKVRSSPDPSAKGSEIWHPPLGYVASGVKGMVTVAISMCERAEAASNALVMALAQTFRGPLEVILVVSNGPKCVKKGDLQLPAEVTQACRV